jgi:hypothetical protein
VHVRGVTGEEHPPDAIAPDLALVAVEARHPARFVHAGVGPERAAGDVAQLVQLDRGAVR